jgi:hypothetical protein
MKKFIKVLSIALVLSLGVVNANADGGNGTKIKLKRTYPIGGAIRPTRCPALTNCPVEVFLDLSSGIMTFVGNNEDEVSFIIYNEDGDVETFGTCVFDNDGEFSTSIGALQDGIYELVVLVNGVEYFGDFEVE